MPAASGFGFFSKGVAIGFAIAAPVGPIGILCIRRTLASGRAHGLASGLGAAAADAIYGAIAAFGLTSASAWLVEQQALLRSGGGVFLLYLGMRTLLAKPQQSTSKAGDRGLLLAFGSTFALTLTNPLTIMSFAAVFAGLGIIGTRGNYFSAALLVGGVFTGSSLWWLTLSTAVGVARERFNSGGLRWANRAAGLIILGFGVAALASLAR